MPPLFSPQVANSDKAAPGSLSGSFGDVHHVTCLPPWVGSGAAACCGSSFGRLSASGLVWSADGCSVGDASVAEDSGGVPLALSGGGSCTLGYAGYGVALDGVDDCASAPGSAGTGLQAPFDAIRFGLWMRADEDWGDLTPPPAGYLIR